jgi:hypothetical protein
MYKQRDDSVLTKIRKETKRFSSLFIGQGNMKTNRIKRFMRDFARSDAGASHLAVSALLVVSILYATTII